MLTEYPLRTNVDNPEATERKAMGHGDQTSQSHIRVKDNNQRANLGGLHY